MEHLCKNKTETEKLFNQRIRSLKNNFEKHLKILKTGETLRSSMDFNVRIKEPKMYNITLT